MTSLSRFEAIFLDVTLDALNNCPFKNEEREIQC